MANGNDEWWKRLKREVETARKGGRSMREISLSAELGENYVEQLVKKNATTPRAEIILRLCKVLGLSPAYIFTGVRMTPEEQEVLEMLTQIDDEQKRLFVDLLHSWLPPEDEAPR